MIYVKKLDGSMQKYDPSKLRKSLSVSGADESTINLIMSKVQKLLYDGIETKQLFRFVFAEFKKYKPPAASRYNLKNSILRLGVAGYAFERLVGKILEKKGYAIGMNHLVKGKYISHEIDISANKENERLMVECKHHSQPWQGCSIQVALYVYARFLDVRGSFTVPMLVTNTKFSRQVIAYSRGVGLQLMGWKYPKENGLECCIEKYGLYPVTMLSSLNKDNIHTLFSQNIVLLDDLVSLGRDKVSELLKIKRQKASKLLEESRQLLEKINNHNNKHR